jgi:hypothetical protein
MFLSYLLLAFLAVIVPTALVYIDHIFFKLPVMKLGLVIWLYYAAFLICVFKLSHTRN